MSFQACHHQIGGSGRQDWGSSQPGYEDEEMNLGPDAGGPRAWHHPRFRSPPSRLRPHTAMREEELEVAIKVSKSNVQLNRINLFVKHLRLFYKYVRAHKQILAVMTHIFFPRVQHTYAVVFAKRNTWHFLLRLS